MRVITDIFYLFGFFSLLRGLNGSSDLIVSSDSDGDIESTTTKLDAWNNLLKWFRENKTKGNHSKNGFVGFHEEEQEEYDVDEAVGEDPRVFENDVGWDSLANSSLKQSTDQLTRENSSILTYEVSEGEKLIRGSSLAFVFDSTGSMQDELDQVKVGAAQILAALRDHPDAPIYNYIWVPFNDPNVGPTTVTTDHKLFQERIREISVHGGGDCPEMSVSAIKKALEASLPHSYIYVFTDASAKDYRLQNEVISLVQRKQAQVVFVLTGSCLETNDLQNKVYERIAETSSGQIYRLSRSEVKEVLKYVKVALQPHVVSLLSLKRPAPDKENPDKLTVLIDESLTQFTVSVSGTNASVSVTDPQGVNIEGPPKLENVLTLGNIKVVNVKEPDPGPWSVFINSDSNYTVRSTGLSKINFNHGFSTVETTNLKETNYRPLKGAKSFILIQTSDTEKLYNVTSVDFVDLNGQVLQHLDLTPVPGVQRLFRGGSFVPPSEFFYLGVTGFGPDGLPVKRITSTAVSGQLPEKPIITMAPKTFARASKPATVKCYVESAVPFTVRWYKNGVFLGKEHNCSETCEAVLELESFKVRSEDQFSCSAKNVADSDSKTTTLVIIGDPPTVTVNSPISALLGETVMLDCIVESEIDYVAKWSQFTARNQHSGVLHPVSTGRQLRNNTLLIESAKAEDEGWYVCTAINNSGESQGRVLLVIKESLTVKVEPSVVNFVEGESARLSCHASGKPLPKLEWLKDQRPVKDENPSVFVEEINGNLNLVIDYLEKRDAGIYVCNAENHEESASAAAELIYTEKPRVKAKENNLMLKAGSEVVMKCEATGYPKPVIKWFKGEEEIGDDAKFQVEEGTLRIESAELRDAGEFSCLAENDLGFDVDYIGLIVGSPPSFLQKPKVKKIQINHNGTVTCSAVGVPPPEVKWSRSDGQELDSSRMVILRSGALKISRMRVEDAGLYTCTAENVFGSISNEISVKVSGIEKPLPDKNIELKEVEGVSGTDLTIPCGMLLGNPPARVKWYKNGVEIEESAALKVETSGELVIRNATASDRGTYECSAENAAGRASRPYEIVISESPRIVQTKETDLKARVGGEIVIPCSVMGFPPPTVVWTRNGLPLPMSSTIFQDESGSLIIRNLSEDNTGVYVCTAINAVGSASKATSIQVQVPPEFSEEVQDSAVNVVEGHVVVLNCNASAEPEPIIKWFKNEEPLLQNTEQPKILRFVANMDDTGVFKCVAENEAGSSSKEFNVTILVPPKIIGRRSEESIKAKAGSPITLVCDVFGVPAPTILWQRNGMYLTQNSSDVIISDSGSLTIQNVTKESTGAYTCDAENLGGITQRIYYMQVNYPPKIIEEKNVTKVITLKEGEEYSLTCLVEGNPKPNVLWRKNGLPIHGHHQDLIVLEDNTLVFLQVSRETTGVYKCEAISSEGSTFKEHEIKVLIPPALTSDFYPTRLEVNEGDSLALTCPTTFSFPPSNIQWIKNGEPLDLLLQERSDEAQMKLSLDQRTLTIVEAHPSDKGNYSCVATNLAGRTDARFLVDVLMTPHFEEFNHVAHRTILTGGEVVLNCSVSGNPQPKVTWRKENSTPITPHNTPGVHVSLDKQHLVIANGKVHHSGTYICLATNKVNTKEREFYVTVLEPPQISGPLQQVIDIMKGDNVTLHCEASGVPPPTFSWTKENCSKEILNSTEDHLRITNATSDDSGVYTCDVTSTAGTRTKYFELNVLELPQIENQNSVDEVTGVEGGNVTMRCKTSGTPKPDITWLHNGRILRKARKRSDQDHSDGWDSTEDGVVSLTLTDVREQNKGTYTLLASNKAGVVEKKFNVHILVPPKILQGRKGVDFLTVVHPFPVVLKCPVEGSPTPWIVWFYKDVDEQPLESNDNVLVAGGELRIIKSYSSHSGLYICLAENPGGRVVHHFNVTVVEPPRIEGGTREDVDLMVNDTVTLHCNSSGDGPFEYTWFHASSLVENSSDVSLLDSGRTLVVSNLQLEDSGIYSCLTKNIAGSAEITYQLNIHEPPSPSGQFHSQDYKAVQLHRPFSLYCFFSGNPPPEITWYKDGRIVDLNRQENSVLTDGSYLTFPASKAEDSGDYKCVARNKVGARELNFRVDIVVSGEWTPWSSWSQCSVSCGLGQQVRKRSCDVDAMTLDPAVKVDKRKCRGDDVSKRKCFRECQVNGSWGSWSEWTSCSETCGGGTRKRYRECDNPKPANQGAECEGEHSQEEKCEEKNCPIKGQWSGWSEWSACSDSCGGGVMKRVRKCDSPPPQNGGENCPGHGSEVKICNRHSCQDDGKWMPWGEWSPCSETCGKGHKKRQRSCRLSKSGKTCKGENLQIEKCFLRSCYNVSFPSSADLHVRGSLNGIPIDRRFGVNIQNFPSERQISTHMNGVFDEQNNWFPYTPFLLSPLSWNVAYETENADNGYSLTDGNFFSQSNIRFASGEDLSMKHKGDGVNPNGTLVVEIEVIGEVPMVRPQSSVVVLPIEQDFVQTGSNTLHAVTRNNLTIEGKGLPFSWNSSVNYDGSRGTMPYVVERLTMNNISHSYDPGTKDVSFSASSRIGKGFEEDKCPAGFYYDPRFMHCQDINECEMTRNLCPKEVCENTFGSFRCVCRKGYRSTENGCLDIDECSRGSHRCSHFCHNTPGSYRCSCPFGLYLTYDMRSCREISSAPDYDEEMNFGRRTHFPKKNFYSPDTYEDYDYDRLQEYKVSPTVSCPPGYILFKNECKDYNECLDSPDVCDKDEACINFSGSFQCLSIPCPAGYQRVHPKNCIKQCKPGNGCLRGVNVSEAMVFQSVTLDKPIGFVLDLNYLGEHERNVFVTQYRVTESSDKFDVRIARKQASLFAVRRLNRNTLYRVKIQAFSYDPSNVLLYFTELVVFVVVL